MELGCVWEVPVVIRIDEISNDSLFCDKWSNAILNKFIEHLCCIRDRFPVKVDAFIVFVSFITFLALVGAFSLVVDGDKVSWVVGTLKLTGRVLLNKLQECFVDLWLLRELLVELDSTFVRACKRPTIERL